MVTFCKFCVTFYLILAKITMLTSAMFTTFAADIVADLVVILPYAIGILATLWGVRLAFSYLKGIAR